LPLLQGHWDSLRDYFHTNHCISSKTASLVRAFPKIGILEDQQVFFYDCAPIPLAELSHKEFLAKPINGSSGRGIVFGCQHSKSEWLRRVNAMQGKVIIQQYLPAQETLVVAGKDGDPIHRELYTKYGVFILGGELAGVEVMARQSPLVHGARNTYIGTCLLPKPTHKLGSGVSKHPDKFGEQ
ncbi:hypothetical protein HY065_00890, partial [Candidatus Berkelbacteria bacterium]|nr:hypothetical protein [Candidatus Berkelbacteria bacterium]